MEGEVNFKHERVVVNAGDTKAPEKQRALRKQAGRLSRDEGPVARWGRWRSRHSAQFSRVQVQHEVSDCLIDYYSFDSRTGRGEYTYILWFPGYVTFVNVPKCILSSGSIAIQFV